MATGEYYLVLGADDRLNPDAIAQYRDHARKSGADIVTARIMRNGKIEQHKLLLAVVICAIAVYVSEHSVGSPIRKNLHEKFGFYSLL